MSFHLGRIYLGGSIYPLQSSITEGERSLRRLGYLFAISNIDNADCSFVALHLLDECTVHATLLG